MTKKFTVTVERIVTTTIEIEADSADAARSLIDGYGLVEAAVDMATDDTILARIKSVRKAA